MGRAARGASTVMLQALTGATRHGATASAVRARAATVARHLINVAARLVRHAGTLTLRPPGEHLNITSRSHDHGPETPTATSGTPARPPPNPRSTLRIELDSHKVTGLLADLV